jgi:hypothetical protein
MSRKKFTEGWDSLFETTKETAPGETGLLFDLPEPTPPAPRKKTALRSETSKPSGKSFMSDLESFLQEAFDESYAEQTAQRPSSTPDAKPRKRAGGSGSGLDALIRSTIEPDNLHIENPDRGTRRLVLFLDEQKISKLKTIARVERTLLRTIVDQIVAEFIAGYEKKENS